MSAVGLWSNNMVLGNRSKSMKNTHQLLLDPPLTLQGELPASYMPSPLYFASPVPHCPIPQRRTTMEDYTIRMMLPSKFGLLMTSLVITVVNKKADRNR